MDSHGIAYCNCHPTCQTSVLKIKIQGNYWSLITTDPKITEMILNPSSEGWHNAFLQGTN